MVDGRLSQTNDHMYALDAKWEESAIMLDAIAEYELGYIWVMYVFWVDGMKRRLKMCYKQIIC